MGRIVRDIKLEEKNGVATAKYTLAVNRIYQKKEETEFFNVLAFRSLAEFANRYFVKGQLILVRGRMALNKYEKEGKKLFYPVVLAEAQYFTGDKRSQGKEKPDKVEEAFRPILENDDLPF